MRQYLGKRMTAFAVTTSLIMLMTTLWVTMGMSMTAFSATLKHFAAIKQPTPTFIDFMGKLLINNKEAQSGDEIAVFTKEGILCGASAVTSLGQYGILHVYADDPTTLEAEGAGAGTELIFVAWDSQSDLEYTLSSGDSDEMPPVSIGSFTYSPIPPVWTADKSRYGLNLSFNGNTRIK